MTTTNMQFPGTQPWSDKTKSEIDPGVRRLVTMLNEAGFVTTDSGDGRSKFADGTGDETTLRYPHVVIVPRDPRAVTSLSRSLLSFSSGIALDDREIHIEASYTPRDGVAVIVLAGLDDGGLKP